MRGAFLWRRWNGERLSLRRRGGALLLTVLAHILVVLLLFRLAPTPVSKPVEPPPVTFGMLPETKITPTPEPRTVAVTKVKRPSASAPVAKTRTPPAAVTPPASPPPPPVLLAGGKALFDAADISKLPSHPGDEADADGGGTGGSGKDSVAVYGPGEGPGGERLYNAEWYREPTHAELAGYIPGGTPNGGWGMIACKTIENNHVENCRTMGESPIGSGVSRALRLAAWQFRVRPPRVGGRKLVGAWVRIRIDFTEKAAP